MKKATLLLFLIILAFTGMAGAAFAFAQEEEPIMIMQEALEPLVPPASPAEVYVSGIEETRATVSWSPVSGATQYSVWVNGQRWDGSASPGAEIKGLQPYTDYIVYVTAANDAGEGGASPSAQFTTLPPPPDCPAMPEVLEVWDTGATIQWQPLSVQQHIHQYRIYVDGQPVADIEPKEGLQAAELIDLEPGAHYVSVSGINENREGKLSPAIRFTVQAIPAPSGLVVANRSWEKIILTWDDVPGAEKYNLYTDGLLLTEVTENTFVLDNLTSDTDYEISLSAMHPDGNESAQVTIQARTLVKEDFSLETLMQIVYGYTYDFTPGMIAVFVIGGAFAIARAGKYALERRRIFGRL